MSGYSIEEKEEIAKRHIIPKELENHGLKASQLRFKKDVLEQIIDGYTRESGVRSLERQLATICRKVVTKLALNILATPFRKELLSDPEYHARVLAREEEKVAKRKAEVEARDAAREALRMEKMEKRKEQARLRDAKRRRSQAEAKKRKAENAARAAAKAAKEARPMSANKRRYLEDKKK